MFLCRCLCLTSKGSRLKTVKKIFYGICFLILLICIVILALAMNPQWSDKLSSILYGEDGLIKDEEAAPTPEASILPDEDVPETDGDYSQVTPYPLETKEPPVAVLPDGTTSGESEKRNSFSISIQCPAVQITAYKEPMVTSLTVPENTAALVGYIPVTANMKEITQSEADTLNAELTIGEDGGLVVFDQNFYPYYHLLQGPERELYKQIYANAFSLTERFKPCQKIYSTQIGRVMEAVFNDHPGLFWVDTAYGCKYDPDGKCVEITLQFNSTAQKLEQSQTTFAEKAEEILSGARGLSSDYEKEKYVHDKLLSKVTYNADATLNQSAYSALVNGQTVCAGYARAYQYLLQQLGIPCYYCTGYSGENHAWNIVKLYGDYYNVDVTWDDTDPYTYDYFNKSDEEFASTHVRRGLSVKLPACQGSLYSGLEGQKQEGESAEMPGTSTNPALDSYYNTLMERISKMGSSKVTFTDIIAADTWHEMDEAYSNGNLEMPREGLIRALQYAGANSCIITFSPEVITENAYNITCTITVK